MNGIFAKWVFTAAYVFAGAGQDLPPLDQVSPPSAEVYQALNVTQPRPSAPNRCPAYPLPCPPPKPSARPLYCTAPGVYTVTIRLGLIAQTPAGGKIWIDGAAGPALLAAFTAAPGAPAYVGASLPVSSLGECYRIRLDASDAVEVIADPAVSFLTITR